MDRICLQIIIQLRLVQTCPKSQFLAETDQNPPLQASYRDSLVLSKVSATVVKNSGSIPSFPGADTKKLFLKKFEILGISIHRIVNGKIKQTYHIDDWQLAVN